MINSAESPINLEALGSYFVKNEPDRQSGGILLYFAWKYLRVNFIAFHAISIYVYRYRVM